MISLKNDTLHLVTQFIVKTEFTQKHKYAELFFLSIFYSQTMLYYKSELSGVMSKPAFCKCENKDADQLRGNREADQHLCFRYIDSTILVFHIYEISSLKPCAVAVQPGLSCNRSETPKTRLLTTRLNSCLFFFLQINLLSMRQRNP